MSIGTIDWTGPPRGPMLPAMRLSIFSFALVVAACTSDPADDPFDPDGSGRSPGRPDFRAPVEPIPPVLGQWTSAEPIAAEVGGWSAARVVVDAQGHGLAVWADAEGVMGARHDGAAWQAPVRVGLGESVYQVDL